MIIGPNLTRVIIPVFVVLLVLGAPLAQGESPTEETRLTLRHEVLRLINRDRQLYGLPPVLIDPSTSVMADAYCRAQIRNGTTGHFTTDGLTPYMRYSFSGGNDGVSENAAAWSAGYTFTDRALHEMVRRSQDAMMAEEPPADGHRRTILDPHATHVGIGLAWEKGEFRMTQEFIRRYVEWTRPFPRAAVVGEHIVAAGKPLPGARVEAITVHHEPLPAAMSRAEANAMHNYSLPSKRRDYLPRLRSTYRKDAKGSIQVVREQYADGRRGDFGVAEDGAFSFAVPFNDGPGIYTVVVWVRRPGVRTAVAASNISIRVDRPTASVYAGAGTR